MNGNTKFILSLIGLFILIATGLGGYAVARVDSCQEKMTIFYVQKVDYQSNINRIEQGIVRLNDKMDEIIERSTSKR